MPDPKVPPTPALIADLLNSADQLVRDFEAQAKTWNRASWTPYDEAAAGLRGFRDKVVAAADALRSLEPWTSYQDEEFPSHDFQPEGGDKHGSKLAHPHCTRCHVPLHSAESKWNEGRCTKRTFIKSTMQARAEAAEAELARVTQERDTVQAAPTTAITPLRLRDALVSIPASADYHAHRYDTDDEHVLHLWRDSHSFDLRARKRKHAEVPLLALAAVAQARDTRHQEKGADMFGIWVRESASREHAEWLRELPSTVDDGDVAVLAFTTRKEAEARAAKHFGYDTYDQMRADDWCEVRPLGPLRAPRGTTPEEKNDEDALTRRDTRDSSVSSGPPRPPSGDE